MINSNPGGESGFFNSPAIVVAAIAICGVTLGAATLLAPATATPRVSASGAESSVVAGDTDDSGYLPAQLGNQAEVVDPVWEMYY